MKKAILKKGKDESLRRFHPWVFSGAVASIEGDPLEEGELVSVVSAEGETLGLGHWQVGSIAVRMLSFEDEPIDAAFWQGRISEAFAERQAMGVPREGETDMYRLVHGEGDNLPGLVVDVYGDVAVMQAHSVGMHCSRFDITEALRNVLGDSLSAVYYKSETTLPYKASLGQHDGYLWQRDTSCSIPSPQTCHENQLSFNVDWLHGQKTGFFLDQRDNRELLGRYSHGRSVLNMFCYTGGFSVYAMRGGARLVHSVDSSGKATDMARTNVELNHPSDARHAVFTADAFDYLSTCQPVYDLIVLDPPAFAKHRDNVPAALRGYTKLNTRALRMLPPGGLLFTFSCSQAVSKEQFRLAVFTAAALAKRRVRILHQLHQAADHPVNIYHPEGEYLKGLVLYVD